MIVKIVNTNTHMRTHTHRHACTYTHTHTHTHKHTHTHIHTHTQFAQNILNSQSMKIFLAPCLYNVMVTTGSHSAE